MNNKELHIKLLQYDEPDLVCVSEIHLTKDAELNVPGYNYFGVNRVSLQKAGQRGSGGTGILVKTELFEKFDISREFEILDNVIGVKLCSKSLDEKIMVFCVYLPPESSKYGKNTEMILNRLTIEVYRQVDCNHILICGDFNSRIGQKQDCQWDDGINDRVVIDNTSNQQGDRLLTFVNDIRGCILNGRITPEKDGFTSITSHKGKAVVDYHITRQSELRTIKDVCVKSMTQSVDELNIQMLVTDKSWMPDHSLITMNVELSTVINEELNDTTLGSKEVKRQQIIRKINDEYMSSELALKLIPELVKDTEEISDVQQGLNDCYEKLVGFIMDEAESSARRKKRPSRKTKAYWDEELSRKWRLMKECEWMYRQCKKKNKHGQEHKKFRVAQQSFDKALKNKKRSYCKGRMLLIDKCNTKDPAKFWEYVKKLGPERDTDIPWEVRRNGELVTDHEVVLDQWKFEFENLFRLKNHSFDDKFKARMITANSDPTVENNEEELNAPLKFTEIE